jgi:hypothetical protein
LLSKLLAEMNERVNAQLQKALILLTADSTKLGGFFVQRELPCAAGVCRSSQTGGASWVCLQSGSDLDGGARHVLDFGHHLGPDLLGSTHAAHGIVGLHSGVTNMRTLDNSDVVRLLRSEVKRAGGQSSWARREHIDRTMLNRVLSGKRPPTEKIIKVLKLCNVYVLDNDKPS